MAYIASTLWEFTSTCSPIQLFSLCISRLDILDIVFIGFCLIGFVASMLAHSTYQLIYPKGTESRQLWSPLAQHPGFLAPDLHNSPESCCWLNSLLSWLSQCSQVSSSQSTSSANQPHQQYSGLILNCLRAVNEAAIGTAIAFQDVSFGNSMPTVKSVTAKICSGPGKELLLHARISVPDTRLKLRVSHWQSDYSVQLVNCTAEAEIELQLSQQQPRASAHLIGRPFVSDVRVYRIGSTGVSQSEASARSDWLAGRVIALLGSALVKFPLNYNGLRLVARTCSRKQEKACQTDEVFVDCPDQVSVCTSSFASEMQPDGEYPEAAHTGHCNSSPLVSSEQNSSANQSSAPFSNNQGLEPLPSNHDSGLAGLTNQSCSPILTNGTALPMSANKHGLTPSSNQNVPTLSTNQSPQNISTNQGDSAKKKPISRLLVKVIRASGIASIIHSSDSASRAGAVIRLELDEPRQIHQTRPAYGITNPYWDENFVLYLSPNSAQLTVSLQQQQQAVSACLSLASLPASGARVLLPLPQSGKITLELLALSTLADEVAIPHPPAAEAADENDDLRSSNSTGKLEASSFSSSGTFADDDSQQLSRQVAEFMQSTPLTPQPVRLADRRPCAEAGYSDRPKQISDYSYARQYENKAMMEFQMSYKRRKANRSRSIVDRIGRALQVRSNTGLARSKW